MSRTPRQLKNTIFKLGTLFLAMGAVLAGSIVATFFVGHAVLEARDRVEACDDVIRTLQNAMLTLQEAETGQRGFLLTGDPLYLEPYSDARAGIRKQLDVMRDMANGGLLPQDTVHEVSNLAARKLDELQKTIHLRQTGNEAAALAIVQADDGKNLMDALRARFEMLENEQVARRNASHADDIRATRNRTIMFVVTAVINGGFLIWAFVRIRREMAMQYVSTLEIERQRQILAVTLGSIGDAVMITDTNGIVTYLNRVAEELTGWSSPDAVGKPCARIFRIINEYSRKPVDSPVDKVLEKGTIVGLANHTLLIRRDGSEIPIDDSGAPIRESDGTIRGVVLVFRDFSAHKESEHLLIKAKEDVEAASRAKDTFLATLSHELRTPLTPVLATLSAWNARGDLPESLRPDLQLVCRNVEMEARLIDDLLDLTRIEHGKLRLEKETTDVHGLLDAVATLFGADCAERKIRCTLALAAAHSHVAADPARLQQVFWNIVGNAVKFTMDGGNIDIVTANSGPALLQITIRDNGIGMSAQTMDRLFQRFEQGAGDSPGRTRGLGLGLSIAKALVAAHDGTLEAASAGPNMGSTFTITLPTAAPPSPLPAKTSGGTPGQSGVSLGILLLEDHADTALVMSSVLRGMGHRVEVAGTVAEGLEILGRQAFDLIFSDLGLPDGSGIDFIRAARKICQTPAVALTGYGMADDVERCLGAGFQEHLTKPIDFEVLQKTLSRMAGGT